MTKPDFEDLYSAPLPRHVAIIMDGNGRWARRRRLPRQAGHVNGISAVRTVIQTAHEIGLRFLTLYAFSTQNWRRPRDEVAHLMGLFRRYFQEDIERLREKNVRVRIAGAREGLESDVARMVQDAQRLTEANTGLNLTLAFNYGGREELVAAARSIAFDVAAGKLKPGQITAELFASRLQTAGIPDPDLVIRTSGERRVSNFLLWQAAYAEYVFTETLWPDFGQRDLLVAIAEYQRRERRFGGIADDDLAGVEAKAAGGK
ncbi:MAG: isoprenyl transferase [Alphaproteobacteria bacterium]